MIVTMTKAMITMMTMTMIKMTMIMMTVSLLVELKSTLLLLLSQLPHN